jgi:hypothetical protein
VDNYTFKKSIFDEGKKLSSQAFIVLLQFDRFYRYSKKQNVFLLSEIQKEVLYCSDDYENVLSELVLANLIKWERTRDFYYFTLCFIDEQPKIKVDIEKKTICRKQDFKIREYVDRLLCRHKNERIKYKIIKLVEGCQIYFTKAKHSIRMNDIYFIISPFYSVSDYVTEKVCDIYNNNIKNYGVKGPSYIRGILNNLKIDDSFTEELTKSSLDQYKVQLEENNKKQGIKIVTGKVLDVNDKGNISYNALLEMKDFKQLNKLWKIGLNYMKQQDKMFKPTMYEWLKND